MTPKRPISDLVGTTQPQHLLTKAGAESLFAPLGSAAPDNVKQSELNAALVILNTSLGQKAALNHGHFIAEINGLQGALNGKQPAGDYSVVGHNHNSLYAPITHTQPISSIVGLQDALAERQLADARLTSLAALVTSGNAGKVIAVNSAGTGFELVPMQSAVTPPAPAPSNTAIPVVSGTAQVGQTLTVSNGTWANSPTSFAYQWRRAGVAVAGAQTTTYVVTDLDLSKSIDCTVTATNATGSTIATSSARFVTAAPVVGDGNFPSAINSSLPNYRIELATGQTSYPPQFNLIETTALLSGDRLWIRRTNDDAGTAGTVYFSHLLTDADLSMAQPVTLTFGGLSSITSGTYRYVPFVERSGARSTGGLMVTHGPDDVKPVLSAPVAPSGTTSAGTLVRVTSNENATLYTVLTTTNTAPTSLQVENGQDYTGAAAIAQTPQAVTATASATVNISGGSPGTTRYIFFMAKDAAGNRSDVLSGGSVTFLAATSAWDVNSINQPGDAGNFTFSNGNRTITQTAASGAVSCFGTQARTTGKYWLEYTCFKNLGAADPGLVDTVSSVFMTYNSDSDDSGPGGPWGRVWQENRPYKIRFEIDFDNDTVQSFVDGLSAGIHAFPTNFGASLKPRALIGYTAGAYLIINTGQDVPQGTVTTGFSPWG